MLKHHVIKRPGYHYGSRVATSIKKSLMCRNFLVSKCNGTKSVRWEDQNINICLKEIVRVDWVRV
jgi:hypothetical protein